jgi:Flp pilus assembly protein TadD
VKTEVYLQTMFPTTRMNRQNTLAIACSFLLIGIGAGAFADGPAKTHTLAPAVPLELTQEQPAMPLPVKDSPEAANQTPEKPADTTPAVAKPAEARVTKPADAPKAASTADTSALPSGAAEYNKGCELFSIAKAQGQKGNQGGEKQLLRESLKQFQSALLKNPKLTEAQSNIGFVYLTQRDYHRAIDAFQKALALNPQHLNTLNGMATAYAFDGSIDKASLTFDKLTTLAPGNSEYYFNKGSVLQKAGRLQDAQTAYEAALKIQPTNQFALFNMGTLLENQGRFDEAKTYYERAKGVEIGNTAGLEAMHRLDEINASLSRKKEAKAP